MLVVESRDGLPLKLPLVTKKVPVHSFLGLVECLPPYSNEINSYPNWDWGFIPQHLHLKSDVKGLCWTVTAGLNRRYGSRGSWSNSA